MPIRDLFLTVVIFGSVPAILRDPYWGVLMWNWLAFMSPHRYTWGFAYNMRFSLVVAAATLLSFVLYSGRKTVPWRAPMILTVTLFVWVSATTLLAMNPSGAYAEWDRFAKIIVMVVVASALLHTRQRIEWLVIVIVLSLGFYGFKGGIFTVMTGGAYAVYGPEGTFIGGNNEIGLALIMTIPLLRYCQLTTDKFWAKRLLLVGMILCLIAVVGTQSRGAFLGVAIMLMFLLRNSRHKWTLFFVMILALPAIYSFMPESWHQRMATIKTYEQDSSAMGRINAWMMAYNLAKDRLTGGGFECFRRPSFAMYAPDPGNVHDAHSIYFEVLGEHGFIGLALFLAIGYAAWRSCRWIMKRTKDREDLKWIHDLGAMLQVSLVGYASAGAFLGLAYFDLYYNLIALIVLAKTIAAKVLRGEDVGEPERAKPVPTYGVARGNARSAG